MGGDCLGDLGWILVGHQPADNLGVGFGGEHRFDSRTLEPAPHADDLKCWAGPHALARRIAGLAPERFKAEVIQELFFIEWRRSDLSALLIRQWRNAVIKALHQDHTVGTTERCKNRCKRMVRVVYRTTIHARVQIARRATDIDLNSDTATQPNQNGRFGFAPLATIR